MTFDHSSYYRLVDASNQRHLGAKYATKVNMSQVSTFHDDAHGCK